LDATVGSAAAWGAQHDVAAVDAAGWSVTFVGASPPPQPDAIARSRPRLPSP
jgi:hypothetical protein